MLVQKEWSNEASDQSKMPKPVGRIPSFQDGRLPSIAGPCKMRGLDGEGRSEGCILHHSNSPSSPITSEVCSGESPVPIHLPPLRSLMCPMDIHEGDEAIDDAAKVMGDPDNNLY